MKGEMLLSKETIRNISDAMKRLFPVILVLLVVALSGCTGKDVSSETEGQTFDRANPNLNGKMMELELSPKDVKAGENVTANLVVGNTGIENIASETIEIKAKARSLDDILANIAIIAMSDEKKTLTFSKEYKEEIKPGMIKPLTNVFPTLRELKGRNLAGIYDVTITLSVNGQKVEAKSIKMRLRSGKPRDGSNTPVDTNSGPVTTTSAPMVTVLATPSATVTQSVTPTPTPTPAIQETTVDTFVFGWDDVPGKDSAQLIAFLKNKYNIGWIESGTIEKGGSDKVINITSGTNYISMSLDDFRARLFLEFDDGRKTELLGVMVDGKLKIYSGIIKLTRIQGWKFTENNINIDAGNWLQWQNMDVVDEPQFTLTEVNGKMPNITVRSRKDFYFNTTGIYKFDLYYPKMRPPFPLPQTITVKLNQSQ